MGAVVTAAVILDPDGPLLGLTNSKKLSEKRREALYEEIPRCVLAVSGGRAEASDIYNINIYQATLLVMQGAVSGLAVIPDFVLADGNRCTLLPMPSPAVVKGDTGWLKSAPLPSLPKSPATG